MNKELVWFNPQLCMLDINNVPELVWHRAWFKLSAMNVFLNDSSGLSSNYGNGLKIKDVPLYGITDTRNIENGKYWHSNFSELMHNISTDILKKSQDKDELRLCYSGGTDSLLALSALLSNPLINNWIDRKKFIIYATPFSKKEDPDVWNRILESDIPIRFLDYDTLYSGNNMIVTGEGDGYCSWYTLMLADFSNDDIFISSYKSIESRISNWFLQKDNSGITFEFFKKLIEGQDISTLMQAWSYFESICTQQCFIFRNSAYSPGIVNLEPNDNTSWFMLDNNFWDICEFERQEKIYTRSDIIKYKPLEYIANWMNWSEPRPKPKVSSQILVPKVIRKLQIYSDMSFSNDTILWK